MVANLEGGGDSHERTMADLYESENGGQAAQAERTPQTGEKEFEAQKVALLERLNGARGEMSDAYFEGLAKDIRESPDKFALRHLEQMVADREPKSAPPSEEQHTPEAVPTVEQNLPRPELEYEMGDQLTIIEPDGTRRPVTPEEASEIARIDATQQARRDMGLPEEEVAPSPGMPRFRLRPLNHEGRPASNAAPEVVPPDTETPPSGPVIQNEEERQRLLRNLDARHAQAPQRTEEQRAREELLQNIDPEGFQIAEVHADNWRGGPGQGQQNIYTHPAYPGARFTQDEIDRAGRGAPRPTREAPRENTPQQPLVPPQALPTGVMPDFIWRRLSGGQVMRQNPLTFQQGLTMDVVLPDKKQQELFGELVRAHGPQELYLRYMASAERPEAMQASDYAELQTLLDEFGHRMQLLEEVRNNLTAEDVTYILLHNPAFAAIRVNLRPERALEVMKTSLSYMFMRGSNNEINAMVLSQRANRDIRSSEFYAGLNERARARTGAMGIKADDLDWNRLDPQLQRRILRPGLMNYLFGGESSKRSAATLGAIQTNRTAIGTLLAGTVSSDATLLARIAREAQTGGRERVPQVGERGVGTIEEERAERRRINRELNAEQLLAQVRTPEFRQNFRDLDGNTWDNSTPEAREEAVFAPYERQARGRQSLLGWFSNFLSALFGVRLQQARQRLATEGAFA